MDDFGNAIGCALWLLMPLWLLSLGRGGSGGGGRKQKTEQGYLIRHRDTQYPMTVGEETLNKALATGDYEYEGPATYETAGGFYDTSDDYVPGGQIPVEHNDYRDDRLN